MYTLVLIHRLKHTRCQILLLLCTLQQLIVVFFFKLVSLQFTVPWFCSRFTLVHVAQHRFRLLVTYAFFVFFLQSVIIHQQIFFSRYFAHFFCTHLYMDVVLLCDIDIYLRFVICYPSYLLFPFYIFFWSERLPERWCEWSLNTSMSTPFVVVKNTGHISFYTQQGFGICHNDYYFNTCTLHQ